MKNLKILLFAFFAICCCVHSLAQTPVTYTGDPSITAINAALQSNNVTITGGTLTRGVKATQVATFIGGAAAGLEFPDGVFFGTGLNAELLTANNSLNRSGNPTGNTTTYVDPDLTLIDPAAIYNVVSYTVNVTMGPKATVMNVSYQFGSEEYPNFVGTQYDDAFGFFVTGPGITGTRNLAILPNGNPTSINKVNYGIPGSDSPTPPNAAYDASQSALYLRNGHNTTTSGTGNGLKLVTNTNPGPFPYAVQFNGLTKQIFISATGLTPGANYSFKIVIADTADSQYDSGVFINFISGMGNVIATADVFGIVTAGTTSTATVLTNDTYNGGAATTTDVTVSLISPPAGFTMNANGTISVGANVPPGVYPLSYQICDNTYASNCKTTTIQIQVIQDSDGDGIDNTIDIDNDNDGIPDCDERRLSGDINQGFVLNGSAVQEPTNQYRANLTTTSINQAGSMWSRGKVDFSQSFVINFEAYLGTSDAGADGIAIVFQNSGTGATGTTGSGIGAGGIANGIALEIDTYQNVGAPHNDPVADHIQIWDTDNNYANLGSGIASFNANVENGAWYPVTVTWNVISSTLTFAITGAGNPSVTYTNANISQMFGNSSRAYFGFTASTGNSTNDQRVRFASTGLCNLPLGIDTDNDGIFDYLDLDSDADGCFDSMEGDENVTFSQILANGRINTGTTGGVSATGVPNLVNSGGAADSGGDVGQGIGTSANNAIDGCICYKSANTSGSPTLDTNIGISTLGRQDAIWPMIRKGGHIALESKDKGLVITRMASPQTTITSPVDGMMVYDTTLNCLRVYVVDAVVPANTGWKCFNKQTCPAN